MPAFRHVRGALLVLLAMPLLGCHEQVDIDRDARPKWIHEQTVATKSFTRELLNGTGDVVFQDGWYNVEGDPKTGAGWRWMDKRGVLRLRTRPYPLTEVTDMEIHVFGWVPWEHVGFRTCHLEFMVNGHVLGRLEPPKKSFEQVIFVPRGLLEHSDWVDFVITTANTAKPGGDWRDLGMGTSGIVWKPAGSS